MEPERISLSARERERLKVLHEVRQEHLTQVEAGQRLGLSDRQVRRLLVRVAGQGARGVVHQLRGRRSNRRIAASLQRRILAQVRRQSFRPTACSTCRPTPTQTHNPPSPAPTGEQDISKLQKTRHFYFALTDGSHPLD